MAVAEAAARHDEFIRRGLRFTQLRLLVALQETGQISAAARHLAITQPAASRLLAELEHITGTSLYTRHARGVVLTQTGRLLAEKAGAILRQLNEAREAIDGIGQGLTGQVRIGAVTGPALELLLPAIRELRIVYPEIEIAVDVDTSDKLAEALLSRRLDFYLGRLPEGVDGRAVRMRRIGPEPIAFVARTGHVLARRPNPTLQECLPYDWVMQPPGGLMRRTVENHLLEQGLSLPERILGTTSTLLTLALVSQTNAIAPLASSVAQFHAGPGREVAVLGIADRIAVAPCSVVLPSAQALTPAADRVLAVVEREIERTRLRRETQE